MKILIAPDKFKGSLTANEVCEIVKATLQKHRPSLEVQATPLADGGEGTCALLTEWTSGKTISCNVYDPLMRKIQSHYGISADGQTAFIEMALASGLQLLQPKERDCMETSTFGTGQLIKHALDKGVKQIVLGIGGSATNDAGTGMAEALGYQFYSQDDTVLRGVGKNLPHLHRFEYPHNDSLIRQTKFTVLCDVENPLSGPDGAAFAFAKQKGATEAEVRILDRGLQNFSHVVSNQGIATNFPGAGAAGGLGAGARVFLHAETESGTAYIFKFTGLESKIREADLIITGEGKVDKQTLSGKVVKGVADLAKKHNKKVIVLAGVCTLNKEQLHKLSIDHVFTLTERGQSQEEAIKNARLVLEESVVRMLETLSSHYSM